MESKQIVDLLNDNITSLKKNIDNLYTLSKNLYLRQFNKEFTTYLELNSLNNDESIFENFKTFNNVSEKEGVVYDNDGFNLKYLIKPVKFQTSYYTSTDGSITMKNSEIIPGSAFYYIFDKNRGFWGYQSKTIENFSINLNLNVDSYINKIRVNTFNDVILNCYITLSNGNELELGERTGKEHSWNFDIQSVVSMRLTGTSNLISINYVDIGLATYMTNGYIISDYIEIENLYKLKLDMNSDIPYNTFINTTIELYDKNIDSSGVVSYDLKGEYEIDGEKIINHNLTLISNIYNSSDSIIIDKDYVKDSLYIKYGYNEWQTIDTIDKSLEVVPTDSIVYKGSGIYNIDNSSYILESNCVKKLSIGNTTFTESTDYIIDESDKVNNNIKISLTSNSNMPEDSFESIKLIILARKNNIIKNVKSYVFLKQDDLIYVQDFYTNSKIRHVIINNGIIKDEIVAVNSTDLSYLPLIQNKPTVILKGLTGVNMIEITHYDNEGIQTIPDNYNPIIQNHIYFPYKYNVIENDMIENKYNCILTKVNDYSNLNNSNTNYYNIQFSEDKPDVQKLYVNYLKKLNDNKSYIKVKFNLRTNNLGQSPTLRSYNITNNTLIS